MTEIMSNIQILCSWLTKRLKMPLLTFVICVVVVVLLFSEVMVCALIRTPGSVSLSASTFPQTEKFKSSKNILEVI